MQADLYQIKNIKLLDGKIIPTIGYGTYMLKGQDCTLGVKKALELGYRHIDTASIYKNEEAIKLAINNYPRKDLFITSKISPIQQGYNSTIQACRNIIQKLSCKYLDLLLIHWPGVKKYKIDSKQNAKIRLQTWKAMIYLQQNNQIKSIGVSNFLKHHLEHLNQYSPIKPVVNQIQIHPLLWQQSTIDYCKKQGIAIQAYSPLARNHQKLFKNQTMLLLAKKYNKSIAQICLRWSIQHGFIVLPKSKNPFRIAQNLKIDDFQLSQSDVSQINALTKFKIHTCWNPNSIKY